MPNHLICYRVSMPSSSKGFSIDIYNALEEYRGRKEKEHDLAYMTI